MTVQCKKCKRKPDEIREYISSAKVEGITPEEYVIQEEGTYNSKTGKFYCTDCYMELGTPLGKA